MPPRFRLALAVVTLCAGARAAAAQSSVHGAAPAPMLGVQAIGLLTRVSPAFAGRDYTEGYLTQPALMAHVPLLDGRLALRATLDLEGLTLERGELTPGAYGEGYVDRRHPHTYTHELIASLVADQPRFGASLSAGKGFAPFGTDDPMMRPFVKFPANHHLAQILERVAVIGAVRYGAVIAEAGTFNGDEPTSPSAEPRWERFGDSWAARLTLAPRGGRLAGVEVQGSYAWVVSPEFAPGGGGDQRKWSASARFERGARGAPGHRYALVEWARTDDVFNGVPAFEFTSLLGEGAIAAWRGTELALRVERTVRPEEERQFDNPFSAVRPHTDASILGRTRWNVVTAHAALPTLALWKVRAQPFVEAARSRATGVDRPPIFDPELFFGSEHQWSLSAGLRLALGPTHRRMGRYGVAEAQAGEDARHDHAAHGVAPARHARHD